jgi:hypothetical protein
MIRHLGSGINTTGGFNTADEAGNVIETHELGPRFRFFFNSACGCQRIALP